MKKLVLLAMATVLLLSSCPVLSLLGLGDDDTQSQDQVELRLNLNGATGTAATVQKFNPGDIATTPPRPTGWTYTGYQFIGWNTAANGSGDAFQPSDPITMLSSITLYAQWRALGQPYSITNLKIDLNGYTARMLVLPREYNLLGAVGADEPPDDILAFGHAVVTNRILTGNLWKYEGWLDNPDPDDPNMLPWQPEAGTEYDVYIIVEFDEGGPEFVAGYGSNLGISTIYPLKATATEYFNGNMDNWTLTTSTTTNPNVAYQKMDQGHFFNITDFAPEWEGEEAMLMVFPGTLDLAEAVSSGENPVLAALGFGTIEDGVLTGGLFKAPAWEEMDDLTTMEPRPWFPAADEEYQIVAMLPDWQLVFFGAGTDMEATLPVVNTLASGLGRDTGIWNASLTTAVDIDMDNRSGQKYKVSDFESQYTDQTAIMLVLETPVDWAAVMNSGGDGSPPEGFVAFGWRWIDEDGTVYGGLYNFFPEIWDAFDTGGWEDDSSWTPWYPDPAEDYELVMILPEPGLAFFGPGTYIPDGEDDPISMVVNPLGLMDGEASRWRLSASGAVTMDMGGGDDGGGDEEPLILAGVSGLYTETRTIVGTPNFWIQNGNLDQNYTDHAVVEGGVAMQAMYELPNYDTESFPWLHMDFGRPCDITAMTDFVFSLDKSDLPDLHNLSINFWSGVDGSTSSSVTLHEYTPDTSAAPYNTYRIPLVDLDTLGLDRWNLHSITIGWPYDDTGASVSGFVYFDDIYFE